MSTRYSKAAWRPLPEQNTEPAIAATQMVFHSAVTKARSIWGYFNRSDVKVESHNYVDERGHCEQYIDWDHQADAQGRGNARALSVETWDNMDPARVPWNDAQMDTLVDIAVEAHRKKGIPLRRCRTWDDPGFGGHHDFKEWNPNSHTCPGQARYGQVDVILSRARAIVAGQPGDGPKRRPGRRPMRKPAAKAPVFPLPRGHWFGPPSKDSRNHSGYYSQADRDKLVVWQRRMVQRGWKLEATGKFGLSTEAVVRSFQKDKGLVADGLIGPATWNAAWTSPVT